MVFEDEFHCSARVGQKYKTEAQCHCCPMDALRDWTRDLTSGPRGCLPSAVEQPHTTIPVGVVVSLSALDLLWCLIGLQVWHNDCLAMAAFKALSLHVSSFSSLFHGMGKELLVVPTSSHPISFRHRSSRSQTCSAKEAFWGIGIGISLAARWLLWYLEVAQRYLTYRHLRLCLVFWKMMFVCEVFMCFFFPFSHINASNAAYSIPIHAGFLLCCLCLFTLNKDVSENGESLWMIISLWSSPASPLAYQGPSGR